MAFFKTKIRKPYKEQKTRLEKYYKQLDILTRWCRVDQIKQRKVREVSWKVEKILAPNRRLSENFMAAYIQNIAVVNIVMVLTVSAFLMQARKFAKSHDFRGEACWLALMSIQ